MPIAIQWLCPYTVRKNDVSALDEEETTRLTASEEEKTHSTIHLTANFE